MNRLLPLIVFFVVSAIGIGMTLIVYRAEATANRARFEVIADDSADRIRERMLKYIALLEATHSFFVARQGTISKQEFATFVTGLDRSSRFKGLRGVGYARLVSVGDEAVAEAELLQNYNLKRDIWPETDQALRSPIVLLEPNDKRNSVALGYDMFSEHIRRTAMQRAIQSGEMRVSAPVELVQEITKSKQAGFLVYIPFPGAPAGAEGTTEFKVEGFVYAPFRAGDLHVSALGRAPHLPVVVATFDTTDSTKTLLFRSANFDQVRAGSKFSVNRTFDVGGRHWTITAHETPQFRDTNYRLNAFVLMAISVLLAAAIATSTWFQSKAVAAAEELHVVLQKTMQDKDLMLQEMKHRIKNSITRVLAISRQTAANSDSLDEYASSFSARLNSMANAQDMLTRSHWQRADLHELLNRELEQVFGRSLGEDKAEGPSVALDERTTQALGLTFHELATNALKYGGISEEDGDLIVRWDIQTDGKSKKLALDWIETSATPAEEPTSNGFGTRLIDANIKGELGGTLTREFKCSGMAVRMTIPLVS